MMSGGHDSLGSHLTQQEDTIQENFEASNSTNHKDEEIHQPASLRPSNSQNRQNFENAMGCLQQSDTKENTTGSADLDASSSGIQDEEGSTSMQMMVSRRPELAS